MSFPTGTVAVLPLKNTVLYPGITQIIRVGREKSIKALHRAFDQQNWILTFSQKNPQKSIESLQDLYEVGVLAKIDDVKGSKESGYQVTIRGVQKVRLLGVESSNGFFEARFESLENKIDIDVQTQQALLGSLKELSRDILKLIPANTEVLSEGIDSVEDLSTLTYLCTTHADFPISEKQKILEIQPLKERTFHVLNLLQELKSNLQVQAEIREKLSSKFGQTHRQQILREQLKTIKEELGDKESSLVDEYQKKIDEAKLPKEALELAQQQLERLGEINNASPEYHIVRSHLDLMVALPWSKSSLNEEIDLEKARRILDEDHEGLEKIKSRILQHLAVLKLKKDKKGSILLFVGPPGVGKTSLGQSIAKALGKKYTRVSVGGVRDDAEIRGHRRTYIGAMAGRIISGIKKAGENNPVFVLDEIDKLSKGFSGDPAGALLEVLDPEQNNSFLDHYLDTGFDLSNVFFIATANSLDTIPGPLLDRMEIIELSGYTTAEKFAIAKNHLLPKQLEEHGLTASDLYISSEVLMKVITSYTREAGVRELQRKIATICRSFSEKVLTAAVKPVVVAIEALEEILGQERFYNEVAESLVTPGVVTGLAWTPVGGDILFVESALMPGKGELIITGQLGDVMRESAQIALTLIKSRLPLFGPTLDFSKYDVHVHVPAGAIPKDGPSAGVTMLSSLASLFLKKGVSPQLAMTGEITLRGSVMPVGGIKEKVLAAHRAGVKEVILPRRNEKDLKEVPNEIKTDLKFHFVDDIHGVLKVALGLNSSAVENHNIESGMQKPFAFSSELS